MDSAVDINTVSVVVAVLLLLILVIPFQREMLMLVRMQLLEPAGLMGMMLSSLPTLIFPMALGWG